LDFSNTELKGVTRKDGSLYRFLAKVFKNKHEKIPVGPELPTPPKGNFPPLGSVSKKVQSKENLG